MLVESEIINFPNIPPVASNGKIRLLREDMFDLAFNRERLAILKLITFGVTRPLTLADKLHLPKSTVYRHLNVLKKAGWIVKRDEGEYVLAAGMFLVYRIIADNDAVAMVIVNNKGAFVDKRTGLIIVTGRQPPVNCIRCRELTKCTEIAKNIARQYNIKLRSLTPAEAFVEILTELAKRLLIKGLAHTYIDLEVNSEL